MKVIRGLCRVFTVLCMIFVSAMMLLMVAEVCYRTFFNRSIIGGTEWAQILLLLNMSSFGAAVLANRQVKVNILTSKFSPKAQVILDIIIVFFAALAIAALSAAQFGYTMTSFKQNISYVNIPVPQWPFVAVFAMSYGVAAITGILLVVRKIIAAVKGEWELEAALEDTDELFAFGQTGVIAARLERKKAAQAAKTGGES
ncbi:MAG: TRAP transporter small permease subunit [Oscillospiraceae bacterium]|nr:TRAP transporter small permease subunit [Oscillospiraceae bacterium]